MAVSQRLDLGQSQSLVMTPQLQQAIKLLELSNQDLAAYVEEELERNPLLEREDESQGDGPAEARWSTWVKRSASSRRNRSASPARSSRCGPSTSAARRSAAPNSPRSK